MEYRGTLINSKSEIEKIDVDKISPEVFYKKYVATRTPVVFTNVIPGFDLKDWSLSELKKRAGQEMVKVEHKSPSGGFGSSLPRQTMAFSDFVEAIESKAGENLYLTTQYRDEIEEETDLDDGIHFQMLHEYCPPPLPPMRSCFPQRPSLLGNLIPQQVNVWVGNSANGTSSGLHHDFHDNLYILIQGGKRFTLFSPADAFNLYTHGKIKKVHPNGLINYANRQATRSDGVSESDLLQHKVDLLEEKLMSRDDPSAPKDTDWDALELELVQAQEALLDMAEELDPEDDYDQLFLDGEMDDFSDDFEGSDDETSTKHKKSKKSKKDKKKEEKPVQEEKEQTEKEEPNSFSKIPVKELHNPTKATHKAFPLLKKAQRVSITLKAGEMLYLPTGWFHEVTSFNDPLSDNEMGRSAHIAFNYWMQPPAIDATFQQPYEDDFWLLQWNQMLELIDDIDEALRSGKRPKALEEELDLTEYIPNAKRKKTTEE
jgi:hypothetical protein